MARPIHTYVDIEFLRGFYKARPKDEIHSNGRFQIWQDLQQFLAFRTDVTFSANGLTEKELIEENPLARVFVDNILNGKKGYLKSKKSESFGAATVLEKNTTCTFWFMDLPNNNSNFWENGFVSSGQQDVLKLWEKFAQSHKLDILPQGKDFRGWVDLKKYVTPLNSILIVDQFILKHGHRIQPNLLQILRNLIPIRGNENQIPLEVMIITGEIHGSLSSISDLISDYLMDKLDTDNVEISIVQCPPAAFHDRHIFTHYFMFDSGNSFNYYDARGEFALPSSTYLAVSPLSTMNTPNSTCADLARAKLLELDFVIRHCTASIGPRSNRLIEAARRS